MTDPYQKSMMDNLYWWGIPTMFRCPQGTAQGQDIALVGVPHSTGNGTTERDQHLGPRALRHVSAVQRRVHGDVHRLELHLPLGRGLRLAGHGDREMTHN